MSYDFRDARLRATKLLPYMRRLVMSTIPVESPGIKTMATDCYLRICYDPDMLKEWSMDEAAGVILHEVMHCFLKHADRRLFKIGQSCTEQQAYVWNIAGDASINETLSESRISLPRGAVNRVTLQLQPNGSTEDYYDQLMKHAPPEGEGEGKGKSGHESGSAADGIRRSWEPGEPGTQGQDGQEAPYGLGEYERKRLERIVAQDIVDHARGCGSVPAGILRVANEVLKPKFDPRKELMAEVRFTMNCIKGYGATTWKTPPRRNPPGVMRMPRSMQYVPRPIIIVDTSGSMGKVDLALALGVVGDVVKALPNQDGVVVITGDTQMGSCQKVFGSTKPQLVGGGGTDMGAIMEQAAKDYPQADVMVVVTDGETPWPSKPLKQRCLALMTRRPTYCSPPPKWMKTVFIHPEG